MLKHFVYFLIFIVFYFYSLLVAKLVRESLLLLLSLEFFYIYLRRNLFESMFHDILKHSLKNKNKINKIVLHSSLNINIFTSPQSTTQLTRYFTLFIEKFSPLKCFFFLFVCLFYFIYIFYQ